MMEKQNNYTKLDWCNEIVSNQDLWALEESKTLPFFIKEEYFRLKDLFKQKQTYGAYLEIKDLVEILLKTPILFVISKLVYKHDKSGLQLDDKVFNSLRFILTNNGKDNLSLGDWWSVAGQLSTLKLDYEHYPEAFILKNINEIYNKAFSEYKNIVNWRNKAIGHGALMFDDDERFRNSIEYLLSAIRDHICKTSELYSRIHIFFYDEENSVEIERKNVKTYLPDLSLWVSTNNDSYKLSPFFEVVDGKVYCFDSYLGANEFELIDYLESTKIQKSITELKELTEKLNLRPKIKGATKNIINGFLETEEDLYLTKGVRNVVEKPEYLKNIICESLASTNKGIYLLQMERGMGKTTFIKMIDAHFAKLKENHISLDDYSVRAYYFNNAYSSNLDIFQYGFEDNLHTDDNGERLKFAGFPFTSKTDFANTINSYQQKYSELKDIYDVHDKLIIILDGIDNISCADGYECALDLIPDINLLNNNCYVILTSRTDEELNEEVRNKLSKISFTQKLIIKHNDMLNVNFVDQVMDHILGSSKNDIKQVLSHEMSNCIQTVNLFKPISSVVQEYIFTDVEDVYDQYFNFLHFIYSDKYFVNIERILILLANSDVPLTIVEIKQLLQIETESFAFLGILEDIKPFLEDNYDNINKKFTISVTNNELKKYIISHFDAESEKLQLRFLKKIDSIIAKQENVSFVDWFTIYYVIKNTHDVLPDLYVNCLCHDDVLLRITDFILDNINTGDNCVVDKDFLAFETAKRVLAIVDFDTHKNVLEFNTEVMLLPIVAEVKAKTEFIIVVMLLKFGFNTLALEIAQKLYKVLKRSKQLQLQDKKIKHIFNYIKEHFDEKELNKKISTKKYRSVDFLEEKKKKLIKNYTYCAFGLDIPISHHNILDDPREFILGVLDSTISYLNQVNQNTINLDMLKRIFLTLTSLIYNDYIYYNFNPLRKEMAFINDTNGVLRFVNQACGFQDIAKWLSHAYAFPHEIQKQWKQDLANYTIENVFSYTERFYLLGSFLGCLTGISYLDPTNTINFDQSVKKINVIQQVPFNFIGFRNKLESMYYILKSQTFFDHKHIHISDEKIIYANNGQVLAFKLKATEKDLPLLKDYLKNAYGNCTHQSSWKQVHYDRRIIGLYQAHVLNISTVIALRNLCKPMSIWHDYIGNNREKMRIVERDEELFKQKEDNVEILNSCLLCINKEYLQLYQLISGTKEDVDFQIAFDYLISKGRLQEQHVKVIKRYWGYYLKVNNNPSVNINIEIERFKKLLFDCKLLYFLVQSLHEHKIKHNIHRILQLCSVKCEFDANINTITYSGIEEIVRNSIVNKPIKDTTEIWGTNSFYQDENSTEYSPEEFYLLKHKSIDIIDDNLWLALSYFFGDGLVSDFQKNYNKALTFMQRAATAGLPLAIAKMGDFSYFGLGKVKINYRNAVSNYLKASKPGEEYVDDITNSVSGVAYANYMLGECYYFGKGVKKDLKQAIAYFEKAIEGGWEPAFLAIIACYINHKDLKTDINYYKLQEYINRAKAKEIEMFDEDKQRVINNIVNELRNPEDNLYDFKIIFGYVEYDKFKFKSVAREK